MSAAPQVFWIEAQLELTMLNQHCLDGCLAKLGSEAATVRVNGA